MNRAKFSAKLPNASGSYVGRRTSFRRVSWGWSSLVRGGSWRSGRSLRRSAATEHTPSGGPFTPVLRQEVVEQVVDRDGPEQPAVLVGHRCGDEVVGGQV